MSWKHLFQIPELQYDERIDFSRLTTMRLKLSGNLLTVTTVAALIKSLEILRDNKIPYTVLGWGANTILKEDLSKIFLKLNFELDKKYLNEMHSVYELPASIPLALLTSHAVKFGLKGWEVFTGIPASLGGALYMNAGTALGEIGSLVQEVTIVTSEGKQKTHLVDSQSFSYRKNHFLDKGDIIVAAKLFHFGIDPQLGSQITAYLQKRNKTQPMSASTCGCVFKNPSREKPAGKLIDDAGLKGFEYKGFKISLKHGNFIENLGEGTPEGFLQLLDIIKTKIKEKFGIELETEVIIQ